MINFLRKGSIIFSLLLTQLCYGQSRVNTLPSWAFGGFVRPVNINPIISPDTVSRFLDPMSKKQVQWEANDTFNPAATVKNNKIIVLYRAEDLYGIGIGFRTSRVGYAESADGIRFSRRKTPVLYPDNDIAKKYEWPGGCEDPRVAVTAGGTYVVFYTEWNRDLPRLGVATSKDLIHWKKHGPIFEAAYHGKFFNIASKSASILTRVVNGKQVIIKANGKYWLYWGEHHVYAATSTNLVDWAPVVDNKGELKELMSPRDGYFDSDLTECGPPALMTKNGIILFYNGKNKPAEGRDIRFNANSYCAGQALFDAKDPSKFKTRLDIPFLRPMEPFEKSGQYINGTVFIEGMVYFKRKWFLYYGCADSRVAVAVYDPSKPAPPDPVE
ncbi:glycoside hydrolase family 130 protein [Mucilaginibacter sp. Mucisp84]|uniref:glycoside hydrolase family 130 protein n=1 Tax=Mucilaginibacter sp. Mucisp84 TaxID=3243058 RepID=UPI0039A62BEA